MPYGRNFFAESTLLPALQAPRMLEPGEGEASMQDKVRCGRDPFDGPAMLETDRAPAGIKADPVLRRLAEAGAPAMSSK